MKQKEAIIFKSRMKKQTENSKFRFRLFSSLVIIASFVSMVTFILFQIKGEITSLDDAKRIIPKFAVMLLLLMIGWSAISSIKRSYSHKWIIVIFTLIYIGYGIFATIYLRDFQVDNSLGTESYIFILIWKIGLFFVLPLYLFSLFNRVIQFIFDSKTRPMLVKFYIQSIIVMTGMIFAFGLLILFLILHTNIAMVASDDPNSTSVDTKINLSDSLLTFHLFIIVVLVLSSLILKIVSLIKNRKITDMAFNRGIVVYSFSLMVVLPLAIWYTYKFIPSNPGSGEWIFIISDIIIITIATLFTFLKKGRLSSPIVQNVIYSLSITLIWLNKFAFESQRQMIIHNWIISTTLLSIAYILILMKIRNNPLTVSISWSIMSFVFTMFVFTLIEWVFSRWTDVRNEINSILDTFGLTIDDSLNILVLLSSVSILLTTVRKWYKLQSKLSRSNIKFKGGVNA